MGVVAITNDYDCDEGDEQAEQKPIEDKEEEEDEE